MAGSLRSWLLQQISSPVTDALFQWRHQRHWRREQTIHEDYFAHYQERSEIIAAVLRLVTEHHLRQPRIFEFGCSGGNNLRLLREQAEVPVRFAGIDVQERGIAFARQHFPEDEFFLSAATTTAELPTQGHFDIFLCSGVLLYLSQPRALRVLRMAAEISDFQVFCELTERFDLARGANDGLFAHPFGTMCAAAGLEIVVPPYLPDPAGRLGIFVTRAAVPVPSLT